MKIGLLKHRNGGFTLIELIIVVIILGILAAVALPKFTSTFDTGKIAEVNQFMGAVKSGVDVCLGGTGGALTNCNAYDRIRLQVPDSAFFAYDAPSTNATAFSFVARLKPSTGTNFITVTYTPTAATAAAGTTVISYVGSGSLINYNKNVQTQ